MNCHGGNGSAPDKEHAHVWPRDMADWGRAAQPLHSYAKWNAESPEYVRFRNPGDLRIADKTCGQCHAQYVRAVRKNIMAHDAMVPESGMYANGVSNLKVERIGEAFAPYTDKNGNTYYVPAKIVANPPPSQEAQDKDGELAVLNPWPRFDITFATDAFRVFEKGNDAATNRALGTNGAVSGVINVALKTRLNDPCLWFYGTNDTPGDYRSSGCTACHVIYANSRDPFDSAQWAQYGNRGTSFSGDVNIKKDEPGHPIMHQFTVQIPSSQCMTCHHHNGNGHLITYLGYMWWDQDTDLEWMMKNGFAYNWFLHDGWGDTKYSTIGYHFPNPKTEHIWEYNSQLKGTQFSDEHGHQWYYNAVFKRDRYGRLEDANDNLVAETDPDKWKKAVHLKDIHLEKGMQCVDCHTTVDEHGDVNVGGKMYGEMDQYIEIRCQSCHGNATQRADFKTGKGYDLSSYYTPFKGGPRNRPIPQFQMDGDKRIEHSIMDPNLSWEIPQVVDYITKGSPQFDEISSKAMSLTKNGSWGAPAPQTLLAHPDSQMECFTCHTSWSTQCYGCHLLQSVNQKAPGLHQEDAPTRLHAEYFPQVLRSDGFTLGINGVWSGHKFSPISPRNPVVVTVFDGNNNDGTHQQSSVGSEGWSSYHVAPNVPHTVRARETLDCTSCHLSAQKDNNAWLAQVFGIGTNGYDYVGDYMWTGFPGSARGVRVSYGYEPQPIIGSNMQRIMDPKKYNEFVKKGRRLDKVFYASPGSAGKAFPPAQVLTLNHPNCVENRGEFLFVADGPGGVKVCDIANVDAKKAAQKVLIDPFMFGNKVRMATHNATWLDMSVSGPMDFGRPQLAINQEPERWSGLRYAYITDSVEGLIVMDVNTFFDRNVQNNYIGRAATFNPNGALTGAVHVRVAGSYAYVSCGKNGLAVVDISDPLHPQLTARIGAPLVDARCCQIQFRYAFVADGPGGLKVLDTSDLAHPKVVTTVAMPDARFVYLMKSYAYVAAGANGIGIIDIEKPETPGAPKYFSANGQINDCNMIVTAATYASYFAYVADGKNGMRVIRLTEADQTPGHLGWSPEPVPELIATYMPENHQPALCVAEPNRRDRVTDESGHQLAMSSRLGSHVLLADDMKKLLYDSHGRLIVVNDQRPRRSRNNWGNLTPPPAAWTPDPDPLAKSGKPTAAR
ncbi:MAG: hypothetical protein ACYCW6_04520 [Candidatus Xenobia bacterium]